MASSAPVGRLYVDAVHVTAQMAGGTYALPGGWTHARHGVLVELQVKPHDGQVSRDPEGLDHNLSRG